MGVLPVLPLRMNGRKPGGPPLRQPLGKRPDQGDLLLQRELTRERNHQLVCNPGVHPVGPFFSPQPAHGAHFPLGHPLGHRVARCLLADDVAKVSRRRERLALGGLSDWRQSQAVDGHQGSAPFWKHPPRKEATPMLCISHSAQMHFHTNLPIVSREIEGPYFDWRGIHDGQPEEVRPVGTGGARV